MDPGIGGPKLWHMYCRNIEGDKPIGRDHFYSMTECGDPKDNAQAERINNTTKNELLKGMRFPTMATVVQAVTRAVSFYNEERPHMSLNMMTPMEAASCTGEIPKKWTSYREKWIKEQQNTCTCEKDSIPLPAVSQ